MTKYTSIDRIFSKVIRDLGEENINESNIIEWCGEALSAIGAVTLYEEAVAFIEVKDHQCDLPQGLHAIIQVARNHTNYRSEDNLLCPERILAQKEKGEDLDILKNNNICKEKEGVPLDCKGGLKGDYEVAYYRPYFDLQYHYVNWCNSPYYKRAYTPVRLANHTFFNSLVCKEQNDNIYNSAKDEYTIIRGEKLRFSFKEGSIALAYVRQAVDEETGYPLIPDEYPYITAITKYITLRIMELHYYAGREGSESKVRKAEADWQWYCGQAAAHAMMPKGIDQLQNILESRNYLLPRTTQYYSFFGKLSTPEIRRWNDSDHRINTWFYR